MSLRLALKAVVIGTIILKTTRNIHLHQGDLGYVGGVTLTFTQLCNTSIAAWATNIARGQFLEHLLDDQFEELAPRYVDRKSTRLNSSHDQISYAVFCLKKKKK